MGSDGKRWQSFEPSGVLLKSLLVTRSRSPSTMVCDPLIIRSHPHPQTLTKPWGVLVPSVHPHCGVFHISVHSLPNTLPAIPRLPIEPPGYGYGFPSFPIISHRTPWLYLRIPRIPIVSHKIPLFTAIFSHGSPFLSWCMS